MDLAKLFERSDALSVDLIQVISLPLYDDSQRIQISGLLCSLAMEHAESARALLRAGLYLQP